VKVISSLLTIIPHKSLSRIRRFCAVTFSRGEEDKEEEEEEEKERIIFVALYYCLCKL